MRVKNIPFWIAALGLAFLGPARAQEKRPSPPPFQAGVEYDAREFLSATERNTFRTVYSDFDEPRAGKNWHVERGESKAKFWLEPVRLEKSRGFGRVEIGRMEMVVTENVVFLLRAWHEYFGN